jgi:hypothetical protein
MSRPDQNTARDVKLFLRYSGGAVHVLRISAVQLSYYWLPMWLNVRIAQFYDGTPRDEDMPKGIEFVAHSDWFK